MAAEADEVGIWYGLSQEEFEKRVRDFLMQKCGWPYEEPVPELLYRVFITRSFGNKDNGMQNNEALVFYGGSVIGNILASRLYALGEFSPAVMSEARNYCMFPNAYVYHLFEKDMDIRGLIRITISRDKTNVDTKLNYLTARIGDCFEALIGAFDLLGRRDLAEGLVQNVLLDNALVHCREFAGLGDAEMRKRWKKVTCQRTDRYKAMVGALVVFEE